MGIRFGRGGNHEKTRTPDVQSPDGAYAIWYGPMGNLGYQEWAIEVEKDSRGMWSVTLYQHEGEKAPLWDSRQILVEAADAQTARVIGVELIKKAGKGRWQRAKMGSGPHGRWEQGHWTSAHELPTLKNYPW